MVQESTLVLQTIHEIILEKLQDDLQAHDVSARLWPNNISITSDERYDSSFVRKIFITIIVKDTNINIMTHPDTPAIISLNDPRVIERITATLQQILAFYPIWGYQL